MKLEDIKRISTFETFGKVFLICLSVGCIATTVKFVVWLFS